MHLCVQDSGIPNPVHQMPPWQQYVPERMVTEKDVGEYFSEKNHSCLTS